MADPAVFARLAARMAAAQAGAGALLRPEDDAAPAPLAITRAVVLGEGGGAPGWARALAGIAGKTLWVVPDADDARRLGEMLAQHEARSGQRAGFALCADPGVARGADLLVVPDADPAPALATDIEPTLAPHAVVIAAGDRALLMALSERLARPGQLVGVHLPPPGTLTDLAEILPGPATVPATRDLAQALARRMNRHPVILPPGLDCPSLALIGRLWEEADAALMLGATPWELDEALEEAGWAPPGPCLRQDIAGLDLAVTLRRRHARLTGRAAAPIAPRMLAEGRLGRRGGVGWYRYPGGGGPVIDPLMEDMCAEEAHFAGLARRALGGDELVARLTLAMIIEAAALAAQTGPALPDRVALLAIGFPPGAGGPLGLARALGLPAMAAALDALETESPAAWGDTKARLAAALAQQG